MFTKVIDEHIHLRLLELRYAEELFQLVDQNRTYLRQWLPWLDRTKSPEDTKAFIQSGLKQFSENNGFQAGIFYNGQIVGCIGLHEIDWNNRKTAIGYWLSEHCQGKGIMTRACRAMIDYAVKDAGLNRVEIRAAEWNAKSRAIPERLGFVNEGITRQEEWLYDHYVDHVIYGMLAEDWKRRENP
jgi:ribosomal-protein-serine acetyltransferase